jgi:hypothetical protein
LLRPAGICILLKLLQTGGGLSTQLGREATGCCAGVASQNRKLGMNEGQLPTTSPECVDGSYVGDSGFMLGWERINLTREYRWPKSLA